MTLNVDRKQRQLEGFTVAGLTGLSLGSLAGALREFGLGDWIDSGGAIDKTLLGVWIIGLLVFGVAFTGLYTIGQRLHPAEREALDDELAHFLSRKAAVFAFVVSFVTAVIFTAVPTASELSGRGVAMVVVGVAAGALAIARGRAT